MADVEPLEQSNRRWCGHRQQTVGGLGSSVAERNAGVINVLYTKQLEAPDGSDDVEDRIDRTHLMQMKVVRRDAVYRTLDIRDCLKRRVCSLGDIARQGGRVDHAMNLRDGATMRLCWNIEIHFHTMHVRALNISDSHSYIRQPNRAGQLLQPRLVESHVDKLAQEHVSGHTAGWIKNGDFHSRTGNSLGVKFEARRARP